MFAREVCLSMRTVYKTKHREEILNYLKTIPGVHFTAADICRHFREQGKNIGTSTVYRQIEQLVSEGLVKKYIIDESSSACFEYIDPDAPKKKSQDPGPASGVQGNQYPAEHDGQRHRPG